ncbi:hypothetical protein HG531_010665 [Fusarium graminearum]|nr:hypothetical protein HG531_010665 [Fusarium graminearum]
MGSSTKVSITSSLGWAQIPYQSPCTKILLMPASRSISVQRSHMDIRQSSHAVLLADSAEELAPDLGLDGEVAEFPAALANRGPLLPEGDGQRSSVVDSHLDLQGLHGRELSQDGDILNSSALITRNQLVLFGPGFGSVRIVVAADRATVPGLLLIPDRSSSSVETLFFGIRGMTAGRGLVDGKTLDYKAGRGERATGYQKARADFKVRQLAIVMGWC